MKQSSINRATAGYSVCIDVQADRLVLSHLRIVPAIELLVDEIDSTESPAPAQVA